MDKPTEALALELAQLDGYVRGLQDAREAVAYAELSPTPGEQRSSTTRELDNRLNTARKAFAKLDDALRAQRQEVAHGR